jgi:apolipoprotein N-acyltransferase
VIFPGAVALDADRPAFLLNITNDAWYGVSAGPYQHLAITRMRAIEEGLPLIRVANTGISAAFDGLGNELGRIDIEQTGFLDVILPPPMPPTLYARYGDLVYLILLALLLSAAFAHGKLRRRRQP